MMVKRRSYFNYVTTHFDIIITHIFIHTFVERNIFIHEATISFNEEQYTNNFV